MAISIYDYSDYRDYLKAVIQENKASRGFQARLAKAAPCQSSYLSQVLHANVQLTPDQGLGIAMHLGLGSGEIDYFVNLVNLARSSSDSYRTFIQKKLRDLKSKGKDFSQRVKTEVIPNSDTDLSYYSAWYWVAIHMIVGISRYQTTAKISERLKLPEPFVEACLLKLKNLNLVNQDGNYWIRSKNNVHLPRNSPLIGVHHNNWRIKAAMNAAETNEDSFHYSVVYTMSFQDYEKIKGRLQDFIVETRQNIEQSEDQELVSICLDCFRL